MRVSCKSVQQRRVARGRGRQLGAPSPLRQREGTAADRGHEPLARMAALMPAGSSHLSRQDPQRNRASQSLVWANEGEGWSCWSGRCCLGCTAASSPAAKERRHAAATRGRSGQGAACEWLRTASWDPGRCSQGVTMLIRRHLKVRLARVIPVGHPPPSHAPRRGPSVGVNPSQKSCEAMPPCKRTQHHRPRPTPARRY